MKSKQHTISELTAELERLNTLVRQRRKQLEFLKHCPNTDCECRSVWREVVDQKLACQVGKIGLHMRPNGCSQPAKKATRTPKTVRATR